MNDQTVSSRVDPGGLGRTRSKVLEELQLAGTPVGVAILAERLGLHPNTVRFHLDVLVRAGLAERSAEPTARPGRPALQFSAAPDSPTAGRRNYRVLAEILTAQITANSPDPTTTALAAGREWGRSLARRPSPTRPTDAAEASRQLDRVLTDVGFRPRLVGRGRRRRVELHHCPFRELAATTGDVVCSIHLGVMQGLLAELDAPLQADSAEPFVGPSLCLIHLRSTAAR